MRTPAEYKIRHEHLVLWRTPQGLLVWDPVDADQLYGCEGMERVPPLAMAYLLWLERLQGKVCTEDRVHRPYAASLRRNKIQRIAA